MAEFTAGSADVEEEGKREKESEEGGDEGGDDFVKILLITANVGSLFEESCQLQQGWMTEILLTVKESRARFLALHMQEVGGKDYERCMGQVQEFVMKLQSYLSKLGFREGYAFLDQNFKAHSQFTALGSVYFYHESLSGIIQVWNFSQEEFCSIHSFEVIGNDLSGVSFVERYRFPKDFISEMPFSRKGYMRTRWHINNLVVDFVNIHLFHDGCNLTAVESPSVYAGYRKNALKFVLETLLKDKSLSKALDLMYSYGNDSEENSERKTVESWMLPIFLFGDFNFRLDNRSFVQRLTADTEVKRLSASGNGAGDCEAWNGLGDSESSGKKQEMALEFQRTSSKECILRVEKKGFDYLNHDKFPTDWKKFLGDDKELKEFPELHESEIEFPPTYPWTEDADGPQEYMKTRAPAWCDRVLMNGRAWQLLGESGNGTKEETGKSMTYGSVGQEICMGDHKPVYLSGWVPSRSTDILERIRRRTEAQPDGKLPLRSHDKSPLTFTTSSPIKLKDYPKFTCTTQKRKNTVPCGDTAEESAD